MASTGLDPEVAKQFEGRDAHVLNAGDYSIVVKSPDRAAYKRFRALLSDEKRRSDAPELLLTECVLYPEPDAFQQLLNRKPALADVFAARVIELAGVTGEAEAKKL